MEGSRHARKVIFQLYMYSSLIYHYNQGRQQARRKAAGTQGRQQARKAVICGGVVVCKNCVGLLLVLLGDVAYKISDH